MSSFVQKYKNETLKISPKSAKRLSPNTFLKLFVYEKVPNIESKQKLMKLSQTDFKIPVFEEYKKIIEYNYNCSQLKSICRYYKLKISGNKKELRYRVWNYLKFSFFSKKIQIYFKKYLIKCFNFYKGNKYKKYTNDTDFMTLESINSIPYYQIISYKDKDNFVYAFDICSLYNLYLNSVKSLDDVHNVYNPYNRNKLPIALYNNMKKMILLSKIIKLKLQFNIPKMKVDDISEKKKVELRVQNIFHQIDLLGFITDVDWFLNLSENRLIRYLRELIDIWEYRAQLLISMKRKICPPMGQPFTSLSWSFLNEADLIGRRKIILNIIELFVNSGVDESSRYSGAVYVLGALTIVSNNAANSLPWLYESFMTNNNN